MGTFPLLQTLTPSLTVTVRVVVPVRQELHSFANSSPGEGVGLQPPVFVGPQSAVFGPTFWGLPVEEEEAVTEIAFLSLSPRSALESNWPVKVTLVKLAPPGIRSTGVPGVAAAPLINRLPAT